MSSVNTKTKAEAVYTHEGAKAVKITPLQQLIRSTMACMLFEDNYYEDGMNIADRIKTLVHQVTLEQAAAVAIEARENMKLRHVPLLIVREMARHPQLAKSPRVVSETLERVIQRADELSEFVAIYWADGKQPLSKQVKLGLAAAFNKFSEYQLAKYNRDKDVKLRDVLMLSHAKPSDVGNAERWTKFERKLASLHDGPEPFHFVRPFTEGELLFGKLMYDKLETPDTWEVELSAGKDKRETFERLMEERKLGDLAFLRNLRNMVQADVPRGAIVTYGDSRQWGRVLPFRFIAAARIVKELEPFLEGWMLRSMAGAERLTGKTTFLVDVSGSMDAKLSAKSDLSRLDAAKALAILFREVCDDVEVIAFHTHPELMPARRGFALADIIGQPRGATNTDTAVKLANERGYDRIFVLTDEQSHQQVRPPIRGTKAYFINVANNQHGVGYGEWLHIDGFSESVVDYVQQYEKSIHE